MRSVHDESFARPANPGISQLMSDTSGGYGESSE